MVPFIKGSHGHEVHRDFVEVDERESVEGGLRCLEKVRRVQESKGVKYDDCGEITGIQ